MVRHEISLIVPHFEHQTRIAGGASIDQDAPAAERFLEQRSRRGLKVDEVNGAPDSDGEVIDESDPCPHREGRFGSDRHVHVALRLGPVPGAGSEENAEQDVRMLLKRSSDLSFQVLHRVPSPRPRKYPPPLWACQMRPVGSVAP